MPGRHIGLAARTLLALCLAWPLSSCGGNGPVIGAAVGAAAGGVLSAVAAGPGILPYGVMTGQNIGGSLALALTDGQAEAEPDQEGIPPEVLTQNLSQLAAAQTQPVERSLSDHDLQRIVTMVLAAQAAAGKPSTHATPKTLNQEPFPVLEQKSQRSAKS